MRLISEVFDLIMIKTIITAAGRGSRLLPATKTIPKEMMPVIINKKNELTLIPFIQLIFEQLYKAKIRKFCFIINKEKSSIRSHFTISKQDLKNEFFQNKELSSFNKKIKNVEISWKYQKKPLGFGDAVINAKKFAGKENVLLHASDTAYLSKNSLNPFQRLVKVGNSNKKIVGVLLCKKVNNSRRYGIAQLKQIGNSLYEVKDVEEKPLKPKSNFAIMPSYFFQPKIFEALQQIKPGINNEFQLTDAIQKLIKNGDRILAITLDNNEIELDNGTIESYAKIIKKNI